MRRNFFILVSVALLFTAMALCACGTLPQVTITTGQSPAAAATTDPAVVSTMVAMDSKITAIQEQITKLISLMQAPPTSKSVALAGAQSTVCVSVPTCVPGADSTAVPTTVPTAVPTKAPTSAPTQAPTAVPTKAPTATAVPPTATPVTPTAKPGTICDWMQFVSDVTVPDGTLYQPEAKFEKIWRLKNVGYCTWTTDYKLVFESGNQMDGLVETNLPRAVAPGETIDLGVNLTAPKAVGTYNGYWKLSNAKGTHFGWGPKANRIFYVQIKVVPQTEAGTMNAFNFASSAYCSGSSWWNSQKAITCPSATDPTNGSVTRVSEAVLEGNVKKNIQSLIMIPDAVKGGYVSGMFPPYQVVSGDKFGARIGCQYDRRSCDISFQFGYYDAANNYHILMGPLGQTYDSYTEDVEIDLSSIAGQTVRFVLTVKTVTVSTDNYGVWVNPTIWR